MVDTIDKEKRSWVMSRVRSKNTTPEKRVRSVLHRLGYRFRLHRKDLPGKPDLVLPKYNTIIFVHGCFWHCHPGCKSNRVPKSNVDFWEGKFKRNVERDLKNRTDLLELGWKVEVIWECETKKDDLLLSRIESIFSPKVIYSQNSEIELAEAADKMDSYSGIKKKKKLNRKRK